MTAPLPPADIASREPQLIHLKQGSLIERIFAAAHNPVHFDRSRNGRLNAPDASYGVLYAAQEIRGAFAETFLRVPGRRLIPLDLVAAKARAQLKLTRDLRLVQLAGFGLARMGATAEVTHGGLPYDAPQAWSKALRDHPDRPDGVAYMARHDDEAICYALFDHAPPCVIEHARETSLDHDWFWELADVYDLGVAP